MAEGQPITEEEREHLHWRGGRQSPKDTKFKVLAAAANMVIKPQSVHTLRLLVEQTAAKHSYNPIEELIKLTQEGSALDPKEKAMIHKALLPFLVPQLAAPKPEKPADENSGVAVKIVNFQFPKDRSAPAAPVHQEKPAMVQTSQG